MIVFVCDCIQMGSCMYLNSIRDHYMCKNVKLVRPACKF